MVWAALSIAMQMLVEPYLYNSYADPNGGGEWKGLTVILLGSQIYDHLNC